jgi:hypothetical protein
VNLGKGEGVLKNGSQPGARWRRNGKHAGNALHPGMLVKHINPLVKRTVDI